jgi:hypothetical protein
MIHNRIELIRSPFFQQLLALKPEVCPFKVVSFDFLFLLDVRLSAHLENDHSSSYLDSWRVLRGHRDLHPLLLHKSPEF